MKNVVIEIDGVRHRLYNKDVVCCGCQVCSLQEECQDNGIAFCVVFLNENEYGHFELEAK